MQPLVAFAHALLHQRGVAAQEVHAAGLAFAAVKRAPGEGDASRSVPQLPATSAGVTEMRLLTMGMPNSRSSNPAAGGQAGQS